MWKTNPDATIEDLDGKSGPGATSTSDASDMSHLGRCLGTRHVKKQGMEDDPQPVMLRYEASLGRYPGYIGLPDKSHLVPQGSHEFCTRSRYFQTKWRFCDLCRMLTSTSMCLPRWWRWRPCWVSWREPGRSSIVRLGTSDLQQDILCHSCHTLPVAVSHVKSHLSGASTGWLRQESERVAVAGERISAQGLCFQFMCR